jgi:hypothetical protein
VSLGMGHQLLSNWVEKAGVGGQGRMKLLCWFGYAGKFSGGSYCLLFSVQLDSSLVKDYQHFTWNTSADQGIWFSRLELSICKMYVL